MKEASTYTHPTFEHFLHFHLGLFGFGPEGDGEALSGAKIVKILERKHFPFAYTRLGADVHRTEHGEKSNKQQLMCAKGESTAAAIAFVGDQKKADTENNRERTYGPIVIEVTDEQEEVMAYYDKASRAIFSDSVSRTLFADPTTVKTSWYGQVNSFSQKKYLENIINQIVHLKGISTLLASHINTERGAMVLTDGARAGSLAIALMRLINPNASDRIMYTIGFTCFVQHFGALFDKEQAYYSGKLYEGPDKATLEILDTLGIHEGNRKALPEIDIDLKEVFRLLRCNDKTVDRLDSSSRALHTLFSIINYIVAFYFTEHIIASDGSSTRNPCFGNVDHTMTRLEQVFGEHSFYRFHREKIGRYIQNADRYYRLHVWSSIDQGRRVSAVQMEALRTS